MVDRGKNLVACRVATLIQTILGLSSVFVAQRAAVSLAAGRTPGLVIPKGVGLQATFWYCFPLLVLVFAAELVIL